MKKLLTSLISVRTTQVCLKVLAASSIAIRHDVERRSHALSLVTDYMSTRLPQNMQIINLNVDGHERSWYLYLSAKSGHCIQFLRAAHTS